MPTGPSPENDHRVPLLDASHLGGLVAGRHHVGEHHGVVRVHAFGDHRGTHIGVGHADVFRLSAVVAARRVRVAEDAADRRGLGVGLVAVAVHLLLAEDALAAGDVEGHQHVVAHLQLLHFLADLLHHAGELMAKRHARPGVRHGAVVEMEVGPADAGARDPDDGILRVQDLRHGFLVDADPQGSAVVHGKHGKRI